LRAERKDITGLFVKPQTSQVWQERRALLSG